MFNEQNEIRGDELEEINEERERIEGHEATPPAPTADEDVDAHAAARSIPKGWENAPLSAQIAFLVSDGDSELFDQIKAELKGEY